MMGRLTEEQARFLKFHLLTPRPHAWSWDGESFSDAQWFTAVRYVRGKRGPTEKCVIHRDAMAALQPLNVWDYGDGMLVSEEGRRLLLEDHVEGL